MDIFDDLDIYKEKQSPNDTKLYNLTSLDLMIKDLVY